MADIDPIFLENSSTVFNASVTMTVKPDHLVNGQGFSIPKIVIAVITVLPDTFVNSPVIYNPTSRNSVKPNFVTNSNQVFNPSTMANLEVFPDFLEASQVIGKPIIKVLPFSPPLETPDAIPRPIGTLPVGERSTTSETKTFKDLSLMFRPHPLTGDVTRVFDYDSVTQALKLIIYTEFFERPFSSQTIAGGIRSRLFEINDSISRREIQERISQTILKHEPRVIVQNILVKSTDNPNAVNVSVTYKIRTFERSETFTMFLERV